MSNVISVLCNDLVLHRENIVFCAVIFSLHVVVLSVYGVVFSLYAALYLYIRARYAYLTFLSKQFGFDYFTQRSVFLLNIKKSLQSIKMKAS